MFRAMANAGGSRPLASLVAAVRAREPDRGACCPLADRRAASALLVASLLPDHIVMFSYGATGCCPAHATWLLLAGVGACRSRTASSIMFHLAQAGSLALDVLVFVGEVGVQAGLHTSCILLHKEM